MLIYALLLSKSQTIYYGNLSLTPNLGVPNNSRLFRFGLIESDICSFCTERDTKPHLWSCSQAEALGKMAKAILEVHDAQSKLVSWECLSRLEVSLPQTQQWLCWCSHYYSHFSITLVILLSLHCGV